MKKESKKKRSNSQIIPSFALEIRSLKHEQQGRSGSTEAVLIHDPMAALSMNGKLPENLQAIRINGRWFAGIGKDTPLESYWQQEWLEAGGKSV